MDRLDHRRDLRSNPIKVDGMYRDCARLIVYSDFGEDAILYNICGIIEDWDTLNKGDEGTFLNGKDSLILRINREVKRILDIATDFGFDVNLWRDYLAWLLISNENSFTMAIERTDEFNGSIRNFIINDCEIFKNLFSYDFLPIETSLGIDSFTTLTHYTAVKKRSCMYNLSLSQKVRTLSDKLSLAKDADEFYVLLCDFYKTYGVGMYAVNRAFRIAGAGERGEVLLHEKKDHISEPFDVTIYPITNTDDVILDDLIGYESQKKKLIDNTLAFVSGRPANNCLLYGDSGTGKSTCIKAICNEFFDRGLRLIEIYKHQFTDLNAVISQIKNRNYYFIIYMDDLSFEEFETEYKFLKAIIEGGVEKRPDNVLIYATSNRRHLIREKYSDRNDMEYDSDMHRSDTMQEKLSLFQRFGVTISFIRPDKTDFNEIVTTLYKKQVAGPLTDDEVIAMANKWELAHGGMSGRCAQQFVDYLAGTEQGS